MIALISKNSRVVFQKHDGDMSELNARFIFCKNLDMTSSIDVLGFSHGDREFDIVLPVLSELQKKTLMDILSAALPIVFFNSEGGFQGYLKSVYDNKIKVLIERKLTSEIISELPQLITPYFEPANGILNYPEFADIYLYYEGVGNCYWTDNGDMPTQQSFLLDPEYPNIYFFESGSITLKAKAFASGYTDSDVAVKTFTGELIEQPAIYKGLDDPYYLEVGISCVSTGSGSADCYTKADAGLWETGVYFYYFTSGSHTVYAQFRKDGWQNGPITQLGVDVQVPIPPTPSIYVLSDEIGFLSVQIDCNGCSGICWTAADGSWSEYATYYEFYEGSHTIQAYCEMYGQESDTASLNVEVRTE